MNKVCSCGLLRNTLPVFCFVLIILLPASYLVSAFYFIRLQQTVIYNFYYR